MQNTNQHGVLMIYAGMKSVCCLTIFKIVRNLDTLFDNLVHSKMSAYVLCKTHTIHFISSVYFATRISLTFKDISGDN